MSRTSGAIFAVLAHALVITQIVTAQSDEVTAPQDMPLPLRTEALDGSIASLLPDLPKDEFETLLSTGHLGRIVTPGDNDVDASQELMAPAFKNAIAGSIAVLDPEIRVEVLLLGPTPLVPNEITPGVYQDLQALSTMEGIEYYSTSRSRMRTLFHESYVIRDPNDRTRLADPKTVVLPAAETLYVFQRDSSFGRNTLRVDYETTETAIHVAMTNLTRMVYLSVFPAVGAELLQIHLVVVPVEGHLLYYGVSAASPLSLFGMDERIGKSFYNRMVALHAWFTEQSGTR